MRIVKNPQYINQCLEQYNIFEFISDKSIEVFAVVYKAGEFIRQPEVELGSRWLQFVVDGVLQLYYISPDGNIVSNQFGAWHCHIGESEMVRNRDCGVFAKAVSEVKVLAVSMDRYRENLLNDPKFLRKSLERQTQILFENVREQAVNLPLEERVMNAMRYHCPRTVLKGVELYSSIFHCSARQLQRVLNKLTDQGKIEKTGKGTYKIR